MDDASREAGGRYRAKVLFKKFDRAPTLDQ